MYANATNAGGPQQQPISTRTSESSRSDPITAINVRVPEGLSILSDHPGRGTSQALGPIDSDIPMLARALAITGAIIVAALLLLGVLLWRHRR